MSIKQVEKKTVTLKKIGLSLKKSGDFIGSSEPFVVAKVGGSSARTQVASK